MGGGLAKSKQNKDLKEEQIAEEEILSKHEIVINPDLPIKPEFLQLKAWTLAEVRHLYEKYRKRTNEANISFLELSKLLPFTRTISHVIFKSFTGGARSFC
jgi:hypothetical protein